MAEEGARRVTILPSGSIIVHCPGCGAEEMIATEPTSALIDSIEAFVSLHSICG